MPMRYYLTSLHTTSHIALLPRLVAIALVAMSISACQKPTATKDSAVSASQTAQQSTTINSSAPITADQIQLLASDVITAKNERYQPKVTITGTLQVANRTVVQSTVNAQVQQVLADVGNTVSRGQPLIRLDNRGSKDQLAQAQADLAAAVAQVKVANALAQKNKILFEQGFVSQIEYQRSIADATAQQEAVKARQAQVNTARRLSGDTIITAPAAGIIGSRSVEVGQVVAPNQPLLEIIDANQLEFAANVPSEAQSQLSIGQSVPFTIANDSHTYSGQISRISPQVDPMTRQLTIYISVKSNQDSRPLKAGMFATGQVTYGQLQTGVLVPMSAIMFDKPNHKTASSVMAINRSEKSDGASSAAKQAGMVWVVAQDQRLRRYPVHIIRSDDSTSQYLVIGIDQGAVVVVAALAPTDAGKIVVLK